MQDFVDETICTQGIISASKQEAFTQRGFDIGPSSTTLAQPQTNTGSTYRVVLFPVNNRLLSDVVCIYVGPASTTLI